VSTRQGTGVERIADAFAQSSKRAALMPYVMAGFPTLADSLLIGEACAQAGADVIELGVPYSDPLADGPVIHAAGTRALAAGASTEEAAQLANYAGGIVVMKRGTATVSRNELLQAVTEK